MFSLTLRTTLRSLASVRTFSNNAPRFFRDQLGDASAPTKQLFIGGLNRRTTRAQLQEPFEEFGHITETRIVQDRETGENRGFGFIEFESVESAQQALDALDGVSVDGRRLFLKFAQPREERQDRQPRRERESSSDYDTPTPILFISNLPFELDEAALDDALRAVPDLPEIDRLGVPRHEPDRESFGSRSSSSVPDGAINRGFGFIHFRDASAASEALNAIRQSALQGWALDGRIPQVRFAQDRSKRESFDGATRGGRFEGGRGGDRGKFNRSDFGGRDRNNSNYGDRDGRPQRGSFRGRRDFDPDL